MPRQNITELVRNIFTGSRKTSRRQRRAFINQPAELLEQKRLPSADPLFVGPI